MCFYLLYIVFFVFELIIFDISLSNIIFIEVYNFNGGYV